MIDRLCVVMPVYNEVSEIGRILSKWDEELDRLAADYEIRAYDDGSRDASLAVMRSFAETHPRVSVRKMPVSARGSTVLTGYRDAAKDGFDWIFQLDSDAEMGPERFDELWSRRDDYDLLVGARGRGRTSFSHAIVSAVARLCVRILYGRSAWDVNSPYRLMRVKAFERFYETLPSSTIAPNMILTGLAARSGLKVFETPVPQGGKGNADSGLAGKWRLAKKALRSFVQTVLCAGKRV